MVTLSSFSPVQATSGGDGAPWNEIAAFMKAASKPFKESLREAIQALIRSYQGGYLTEEEFNALLAQVVSVAVEREFEDRIGSLLRPSEPRRTYAMRLRSRASAI